MQRTNRRAYYLFGNKRGIDYFSFPSQYIQIFIMPLVVTLCAFIGIAVTSAGEILYGATFWDPATLINRWDSRTAAFFASFSFALACLGTNISANSLSAANDMTALWPRWVNIRRGQVRMLFFSFLFQVVYVYWPEYSKTGHLCDHRRMGTLPLGNLIQRPWVSFLCVWVCCFSWTFRSTVGPLFVPCFEFTSFDSSFSEVRQ